MFSLEGRPEGGDDCDSGEDGERHSGDQDDRGREPVLVLVGVHQPSFVSMVMSRTCFASSYLSTTQYSKVSPLSMRVITSP
nr:MAG TPA: hypothetical protein [Caudoviricetes sp.]